MHKNHRSYTIVGIDLAGSPQRNTGLCRLRGNTVAQFGTVHSDDEIIRFVDMARPDLIAIDAPLNLPPGRLSIEDRNGEHFRPCDRALLERGIRFFPITLGPMRSLTLRGIFLKKKFSRRGYRVIEIYPGAAQDIWNIKRKQHGLNTLRRGLENIGVRNLDKKMNGDELDAVTGAFVGKLFLQGKAEMLGNLRQGAIIVPQQYPRKHQSIRRSR